MNNKPNNNQNNNNTKGTGQTNRNRNRKRNNNRRRNSSGPRLSTLEKTYRSYLNLLEKHVEARKKYFELFYRADPKQLEKLEKNFNRALSDLRDFEDNIKDEVKEEFFAKINGLKPDTTYSINHSLDPQEAVPAVSPDDIKDPHFLPSQEESFKEDSQESSGSMEEYYSYKGIEPPTPEVEAEEKEKTK